VTIAMTPYLCLLRRCPGRILCPFSLLLWFAFMTAPGCSRGPQFAAVEGKVTVDGRPLKDVEVLFLPDPDTGTVGPASTSYTDEHGHYRLRTNKGRGGAVVGTHRVCLRDLTTLPLPPLVNDPEAEPARAGAPRGKPPGPKLSRVPVAYNSAQETPLRAVQVKPGEQTLDFPLESQKKK
jgi:hypothetical protein